MADRIEITIAATDESGGAFQSARANVDSLGSDLSGYGEQFQSLFDGEQGAGAGANVATEALGSLSGVLGVIGAVGIPTTLAGLGALALQLDESGAAATRFEDTLNVLTNGNALQWTDSMQTATHGLIDDTDAAQVASQFLSSGMATSAEQASHFVEVATTLGGAIKGLDAKTASEELANMFSSGNVRAAKDFGLSVIELRDRVKELKDADSGLTDQQALMQAFFDQADPLAAKLAGTLDDQVAAAQKLKVAWADLGETIGQTVSKGMAPAQELGADFINVVTDMIKGDSLAVAATKELGGAQKEQTAAQKEQTQEMAHAGLIQGMYADVAKTSTDRLNAQVDAMKAANGVVDLTDDQYKKALDSISTFDKELENHAGLLLNAEQQVGKLSDIWWGAGTSIRGSGKDIADLNKSLGDQSLALDKANLSWGDHAKHTDLAAFNLDQLNKKVDETKKKLDDATQTVQHSAGVDMGKLFQFTTAQMGGLSLSADQMLTKYNELGLATGKVSQAQITQAKDLAGLNKLYGDGKISVDSYLTGLAKIPGETDKANAASQALQQTALHNSQAAQAANNNVAQTAASSAQTSQDALSGTSKTLSQVQAQVDALAKSKTPINMDSAQVITAQDEIGKVQLLLGSLKNKTIEVQVNYSTNGAPPGVP